MTYEEIEAFLAVVECGTMSQAAQRLSLSQSTVSSQIKSLENEFGVTLFQRGRGMKSATLTEHGRSILDIAYKWEFLWNETKETLAQSSRHILQIAAVPSVSRYLLYSAVSDYAEEFPQAYFQMWNISSEKCYSQVDSGDINAAFVTRPRYSATVKSEPLVSERFVFIGGKSCKFEGTVHPSELDVRKQIFQEWDANFLEWYKVWWEGYREAKVSTNSVSFLKHMMQNMEDSWSILPISIAKELANTGEFKICEIVDGPENHFVYMLTRNHSELPQGLVDFLEVLRENTAENDMKWHYDSM